MIGLVIGCLLGSALPARAGVDEPIGKFRNTYYYLIFEAKYPKDPKTEPVLDSEGKALAMVSKKFLKDLLMEGSGKLANGKVLNWAGRVDGQSRFEFTKHPWGRGVGDCGLRPLRTIAADPAQIPQGAVVKIAETVGMPMPDGTKHDGIWRVEDVGSAILHDRIDLFVGKREYAKYLTAAKIDNMQPLTVTILEQPLPDSCVFKSPQ
jgi:3D (Asp-Asp-Asp) domain-containing protein